jgi:hypothetical protein
MDKSNTTIIGSNKRIGCITVVLSRVTELVGVSKASTGGIEFSSLSIALSGIALAEHSLKCFISLAQSTFEIHLPTQVGSCHPVQVNCCMPLA